jgi:hypothetical protein
MYDKVRTPADLYVYCDMPLLIPGGMLSDKQLRTDGVNELDVQLQPDGDNPSWVSKDQMDRIMGVFMGLIADRQDDWSVQEAALLTVTESYEAEGWTVADMTDEEMGYNLYCTSTSQEALVLVKGAHHAGAVVLYEDELKVAKAHPDSWHLALVTDALTDPQIETKTAAETIEGAEPYAYALKL